MGGWWGGGVEDICKKYRSLQSLSFEFISKVKDPAALFLFPFSALDVLENKGSRQPELEKK